MGTVDDEDLDQSNLQRYVMAIEREVGKSKVKLGRRYLRDQSAVVVESHGVRVADLGGGGVPA
ncbi:MAG TPA: hypothetical protein VN036_02475 [Devosia sp.]|jgi:tRNA A37 threonylcarbamoyladenosine dehydratase|nr:hypothetical protein [Devosia sp.]